MLGSLESLPANCPPRNRMARPSPGESTIRPLPFEISILLFLLAAEHEEVVAAIGQRLPEHEAAQGRLVRLCLPSGRLIAPSSTGSVVSAGCAPSGCGSAGRSGAGVSSVLTSFSVISSATASS